MTTTGTATTKEPTREELLARIAELERQTANRGSNIKLSEKGAISTYGLGKFPVSLYVSQAEKLMDIWGENYSHLKAFIAANRGKLSVKPAKS